MLLLVFVGRLYYERYILGLSDDRAFFTALHAEYALLFWASLVAFSVGHIWAILVSAWILVRRGPSLKLLPFVAIIALELCVAWLLYPSST